MTDVSVTSEKPPAPKQSFRNNGGVRGWFGRQPWPLRTVIILVVVAVLVVVGYLAQGQEKE